MNNLKTHIHTEPSWCISLAKLGQWVLNVFCFILKKGNIQSCCLYMIKLTIYSQFIRTYLADFCYWSCDEALRETEVKWGLENITCRTQSNSVITGFERSRDETMLDTVLICSQYCFWEVKCKNSSTLILFFNCCGRFPISKGFDLKLGLCLHGNL